MPCIWVACIAMNALIFYGLFITCTLCVHVTKENAQVSSLIDSSMGRLQKEYRFNINWF